MLNSARRLLIPWVLFNLLYLVLRASLEYFGFFSQRIVIGSSWVEILRAVYHSQISEQMYFLLSLFFIRSLGFGMVQSGALLRMDCSIALGMLCFSCVDIRCADNPDSFHPIWIPFCMLSWG